MIKRLHLYVIKSFLGPFFLTFFIVLFVLLMQFLWRSVDEMVGKGIDFSILAEMMFYASFALLPYAFPLAMLLASIMTFGALGENYELVAIKASGISLFRMMRPLLLIVAIVTLAAFYMANNVVPKTNLKFSALLYSVREQRPELILKSGVFTEDMGGFSIKVESKNDKTKMLYDLLIYDHREDKANETVIVADSGMLRMTEDKRYMVLDLYDGEKYDEQNSCKTIESCRFEFNRSKFQKQTLRVRVTNFEFNRQDDDLFENQYRMLSVKELLVMEDSLGARFDKQMRNYMMQLNLNPTMSNRMYNLIAPHDSLVCDVQPARADMIFDVDERFASAEEWMQAEITRSALESARRVSQTINLYEGQLGDRKRFLNQYEMERHRKYTLSFAVLIFFFIGAPLGAIIRKGGLGMPVVVSILLFIVYYIVSMSGEKTAREDVWSMINGMWFSSYIFLPIGAWLTYKAATDSAIMTAETYTKFFSKLGLNKLFRAKQHNKKY